MAALAIMSRSLSGGSMVALITPMQLDGEIDLQAWQRLLLLHVQAGTDAVIVAGTTGEGACLEPDEIERLLREAVRLFGDHGAVICGIGSPATAFSLHLLQLAEAAGADAVLAVTPYYNKPPQACLVAHYRALASVGLIDPGIRLPLLWMPAPLQQQHQAVVIAAWQQEQALLA
jgi:dihydrodipicolinate synthase/N-acetylneuraminate lyase